MTVKEKLVGAVQNELKMDLITACKYVQQWIDNFMGSNKKESYINIGQKRFLVNKKDN